MQVLKPEADIEKYSLSYEYDKNGNLIKDHRGEYTYNAFDQMIEAKVQGEIGGVKVQKNYYDAEELRYQVEENKRLTQYIYNQDKQAVVEIQENEPNRIIRGDQILSSDSENAKLYYHYMSDERGSITHIVGDAANIKGMKD